MKKYRLLDSDTKVLFGRTLFRIQALISFSDVQEGDLGGYIEKEKNLSHDGNAWVYNNAQVFDEARVCGSAKIFGNAMIYDNAGVRGNVQIYKDARVYENAQIYDNACVSNDARICGDARIYGSACISGNAYICGDAQIYDYAWVFSNVRVFGNTWVCGNARVGGNATIFGNAYVCDNAYVGGNSWVSSDTDILYIKGIGSTYPCITVCMTRDRKLFVMRKPFSGTLSEFETEVKKTYGDSKNAREYQLFIELVKLHFNIEEN